MKTRQLLLVSLLGVMTSACVTSPSKTSDAPAAKAEKSEKGKDADKSAAKEAKAKSTVGMNDKGEVVDSSKVEAGSGTVVKGINDTEGEITGKPAPNGKFAKLKIGMTLKEVTDLIGQPNDQGAYMTGKAWIPFYFGRDQHRYEQVYQNSGRLVFAAGSLGEWNKAYLIWIIHNKNEGTKR